MQKLKRNYLPIIFYIGNQCLIYLWIAKPVYSKQPKYQSEKGSAWTDSTQENKYKWPTGILDCTMLLDLKEIKINLRHTNSSKLEP